MRGKALQKRERRKQSTRKLRSQEGRGARKVRRQGDQTSTRDMMGRLQEGEDPHLDDDSPPKSQRIKKKKKQRT
jgi:hypothetical protein